MTTSNRVMNKPQGPELSLIISFHSAMLGIPCSVINVNAVRQAPEIRMIARNRVDVVILAYGVPAHIGIDHIG